MFAFLEGLKLPHALGSVGVILIFSFFKKIKIFILEKLIATAAICALTVVVLTDVNGLGGDGCCPLEKSQILL